MSCKKQCVFLIKNICTVFLSLLIFFTQESKAESHDDITSIECKDVDGARVYVIQYKSGKTVINIIPFCDLDIFIGGGKADPFGPPPSPFIFSNSTFLPGTFTYNNTLTIDGTVITPTLTSFSGIVEFTPTLDPLVMDAKFTSYEFDFEPFLLPGISTPIYKQMQISGIGVNTGSLNLGSGYLNLHTVVGWYNTSNELVYPEYIDYSVIITDTADPNIVDVSFSSSTSCTCPEPSTVFLLGIGLTGMAVARRKQVA